MRAADEVARPPSASPSSLSASSAAARAEQRHAAARDDALLDRRARRVERVLDAGLLLLHLGLGVGADLDHRDAARELREALLELLLVVVARRRSRSACGSPRRGP